MIEVRRAAHPALALFVLIFAGEAVFALPFHIARFFRPTLLDVTGMSATELGAAQGVYGIVAMAAYFPGGPIADRFAPRKLLAISLWATAAGGLYLASFPGARGAMFIWGFFGLTTILLFWAAMIRAVRQLGAAHTQGRMFGVLEGGRGLLAVALAAAGVWVLSLAFPEDAAAVGLDDKRTALQQIVWGYAAVTAVAGALVWAWLPDGEPRRGGATRFPGLARVMKSRGVWLQGLVVLCAYVGYKGLDHYTLYAVEGYGMTQVEAATVLTVSHVMRPIAAVVFGLVGDKVKPSRAIVGLFVVMLGCDLFFAIVPPVPGKGVILLANTVLTCAAVFGLRGLYFALLEEQQIPRELTGTAVGVISTIGYTPDIFVNYVMGVLVDATPGVAGHQHVFWFLAAFAGVGVVASAVLRGRGGAASP